jgi:hypothetical protein
MQFFLNKMVSLCDTQWGNFNKFAKFVKMARVERVKVAEPFNNYPRKLEVVETRLIEISVRTQIVQPIQDVPGLRIAGYFLSLPCPQPQMGLRA